MIVLSSIIDNEKDLYYWIDFIIKLHNLVVAKTDESSYVLSNTRQKLAAIVTTSLNYYTLPKEKVLALFYYLIKDHPFLNANKRTAVAVLLFLCQLWQLQECPSEGELVRLSLKIAKKELNLLDLINR